MTAEGMLFAGTFLGISLVLVGVAWGFLLIKLQGESE